MKLILAVVNSKDRQAVLDALVEGGYNFTEIASTGGFLREGNATILLGTEAGQVEGVVRLIGAHARSREQFVNVVAPTIEPAAATLSSPIEIKVGGAIVFILNVERVERF